MDKHPSAVGVLDQCGRGPNRDGTGFGDEGKQWLGSHHTHLPTPPAHLNLYIDYRSKGEE